MQSRLKIIEPRERAFETFHDLTTLDILHRKLKANSVFNQPNPKPKQDQTNSSNTTVSSIKKRDARSGHGPESVKPMERCCLKVGGLSQNCLVIGRQMIQPPNRTSATMFSSMWYRDVLIPWRPQLFQDFNPTAAAVNVKKNLSKHILAAIASVCSNLRVLTMEPLALAPTI